MTVSTTQMQGLMALMLAGSLSLNVGLALAVRQARARVPAPAPNSIKTGANLNQLPVLDQTGASGVLTITRPSIVYVFSPECSWCQKNYRNLLAVASATKGRYDMLGISPTSIGLTSYLEAWPFPGQTMALDSTRVALAVRKDIGVTPQMAVTDSSGNVLYAWTGALDGDRKKDAELVLGLSLPGLSQD